MFACISHFLTVHLRQDNGGRKARRCLQDNFENMDIGKVVDWVCHGKLEHAVQHNEPTGQAKLKKVRCY